MHGNCPANRLADCPVAGDVTLGNRGFVDVQLGILVEFLEDRNPLLAGEQRVVKVHVDLELGRDMPDHGFYLVPEVKPGPALGLVGQVTLSIGFLALRQWLGRPGTGPRPPQVST